MEKLLQELANQFMSWMPNIAITIVILLAFFILSRVISKIINTGALRSDLELHLASLIRRANRVRDIRYQYAKLFNDPIIVQTETGEIEEVMHGN